jgi:hypothetical protein
LEGVIRLRDKKVISTRISTSVSSLLGNITGYAKHFIESKFPPGYFKKVYITDSLTELQMEEKDVQRPSYPMLIITPVFTGELNGTDWRMNQQIVYKGFKGLNVNKVLHDSENNIRILSIPDRIRVTFEIRVILGSQMQAYNMLHYLKQVFEFGGFNYLNNVRLHTEVPKLYVLHVAEKLGLDINTPDGREALDEYFLNHSYNSITEKINLSSGNSQYSYGYNANILANFTDEPSYEKDNDGLIIRKTAINFAFNFDFWSHSYYIMEVMDDEIDMTKMLELDNNSTAMKYDFYVPTHFIKEQLDNMHLIVYKSFLPDVNTDVDILEFKPIVNSELQGVISEAIKHKLDLSKIISARVLIDNKELDEDLYKVDWKNYNLITQHPMNNVTYTLIIYGNLKVLNLISQYIIDGKLDEISKIEL